NAQAGRVYGAVYERRPGRPDGTDETIVRVQDAAVHDDPGAWLASLPAPFAIVGEGIEAHRAACEASGGVITPPALWTPSAAAVAEIGAALAAAGHDTARGAIVPLYLRPPACEEVYEQRRAAARARREQSQGRGGRPER